MAAVLHPVSGAAIARKIECNWSIVCEAEHALVIAEAPTLFAHGPSRFVPEVNRTKDGMRLVMNHTINRNNKELEPLAEQGFKLRRQHLMEYLITALDETPDTPAAILHAFDRMNSELEPLFKGSSCWENYWRCQYSSTVVVVGHGHVYVAGDSSATVILSRNGKDMELTDQKVLMRYALNRASPDSSLKEITGLCYYRKEALTKDDSDVILCSGHARAHIDGGNLTPVLTTRIDAFGMEEACRQITGEYFDFNRTLVVVPLKGLRETGNYHDSDPCTLGWVNSIPPKAVYDDDDEAGVGDDDDDEDEDEEELKMDEEEYEMMCGPDLDLTPLKPLDGGKPQHPLPFTSCKRGCRVSPCIRFFSKFSVSWCDLIQTFDHLHEVETCEVWYGGRALDIMFSDRCWSQPRGRVHLEWCYKGEIDPFLIRALLQDKVAVEDSHVVLWVQDKTIFRALVAATDGLAFWDVERWRESLNRAEAGKTFGFFGPPGSEPA